MEYVYNSESHSKKDGGAVIGGAELLLDSIPPFNLTRINLNLEVET